MAFGLVNHAVAPHRLTQETMALAAKIAAQPFATLRTGKHAFYEQVEIPLEAAYHYATQVMTEPSTAMEPMTPTTARKARDDSNARWVNIRW